MLRRERMIVGEVRLIISEHSEAVVCIKCMKMRSAARRKDDRSCIVQIINKCVGVLWRGKMVIFIVKKGYFRNKSVFVYISSVP